MDPDDEIVCDECGCTIDEEEYGDNGGLCDECLSEEQGEEE